LRKLLSLLIVLALVVTVGLAENEPLTTTGLPDSEEEVGSVPETELGNLSEEALEEPATPGVPQDQDYPMAVVINEDGEETGYGVQMRDVENEYQQVEQMYAQQQQNYDPVFDGVFVKYDIATMKAESEMLDMYAVKENITVDPLKLEEETNSIVSEVTANEEYKKQVQQNYGSVETFYEFVKAVKQDEMRRQKVIEKVAPVNEEVLKEQFLKNESQLVAEYESVKARHILVSEQEKAEEIKKEIQSGEMTFEEAAKEYSEGPTGKNGGNLDWFGRGEMVPEFEAAAFSAELGKVIGPVKTQFGYHLILPEDRKDITDYESFKNMTEEYEQFKNQTQQKLLNSWIKEYKSDNNIEFDYQGYLQSIHKFGKLYTEGLQTQSFSKMVDFLIDYKADSFEKGAFFEVAVQSMLNAAQQQQGIMNETQMSKLSDKRVENLKRMAEDSERGFSPLSRYHSLRPDDTRMALRFYDTFISEALKLAQNEQFMTQYGDAIIQQLMQAYPGLKEIGEKTEADKRDRVVAYMYMIRINKVTGDTEKNEELSEKILELDPDNEEVLKLIEDE